MQTKNVPFFDYKKVWTNQRNKLMKTIDDVASSGGFILQKELADFEKALALYFESKYSVGVGNATDGMEIFLEAIGIDAGDEIIISSHTMLATASAIKMAGGVPIPVDIGDDNLICPNAISEAIGPKTVGIMPTQLNGRTCAMDPIIAIAEKNSLFVVEDAAQALGSRYKGKCAGTFGLASTISFFPAKVLGCLGDGGAVLVNDESIYKAIYQIHEHGRDVKTGEVMRWGRNSRLDNIQAAILSLKLETYGESIARRRDVAQIYHQRLNHLQELKLPQPPSLTDDHFDVFQNYELVAERRDDLRSTLSKFGVGTLIQWGGHGIHHFKQLGFTESCPRTDLFFNGCLMLPMNDFISDDDVHYVCDVIRDFYRG